MKDSVKFKILSLQVLIFLAIAYIIVTVEKHVYELHPEEVNQIVLDYRAKYDTRVPPEIRDRKMSSETLKIVFGQIPKQTLVAIVRELTDEQYGFMLVFFSKLSVKEQHWLSALFKHLNASELRRLIIITNKIGVDRTLILVDLMTTLPIQSQKDIIRTLFRIPLSDLVDLVYVMQEMNSDMIETMFEVLVDSKDLKSFLQIIEILDLKTLTQMFRSIQKLPDEQRDLFVKLVKDLDGGIFDSVALLVKLDRSYLMRMLTMLAQLNVNDKRTFVKVFNRMSTEHVKRAIEIMESDDRILDSSMELTDRLDRHLVEGEETETLERAVNTASRVRVGKRFEGLVKLKESRTVRIRRMMKQVDGYQETYTGNTIEKMVDDYDSLENPDRLTDILSGSDGIIHGSYRGEPRVSQERKLFRVREMYSGNKRGQVLDFYDRKPYQVPQRVEDTFIILPPQELEELTPIELESGL